MRILLVTHYYPLHRGGIEIVAGEIARRLSVDHHVRWAASDSDAPPASHRADHRGLDCVPMRTFNGIERVAGLPFPLWSLPSLLHLWRETKRADVVHLHDFMYLGNWIAFFGAIAHRRPVLITQHVGFIPYNSRLLRGVLRALHATLGKLMLGRADQVAFVSAVVREYYEGFVRFRRPPMVIANGVDGETFAAVSAAEREAVTRSLAVDPATPRLLFVGRFVEKKGLAILEAVARRLTGVSWMFAGWGPLDPSRWNIPAVRVFEGRRGDQLAPLYQSADLLVLPSVGEGLPLVVQEAMSCGTPVLVGADTAAAVNADPGLVFACRVDGPNAAAAYELAIADALSTIRTSPDLRERVARFARSRWSWSVCADTYAAVLATLTVGANGG